MTRRTGQPWSAVTGVEHRPLLGQVLAGREARGVVPGLAHLVLGLRAEERHLSPTLILVDVANRPRAFVRVAGPDACDYLQRMVSNDVEALQVGDAVPALLLTAKARVIAPLVVLRRGEDDFLLLTEPELGEAVHTLLTRMRLRAQAQIEPEDHRSLLVFDETEEGFATDFPGARELLDADGEPTLDADEPERR